MESNQDETITKNTADVTNTAPPPAPITVNGEANDDDEDEEYDSEYSDDEDGEDYGEDDEYYSEGLESDLTDYYSQIEILPTDNELYRKSLGRVAPMGYLYNAVRDCFCGLSLYNTKVDPKFIEITDVPNTEITYDLNDSHDEQFKRLSVESNLKLSVMSGMASLEGSGKYLNEQKKTNSGVKCTMTYSMLCSQEQIINPLSEELLALISENSLKNNNEATHVVTGIKWGGTVVVSFEQEVQSNESKKEVAATLKASVQNAAEVGTTMSKQDNASKGKSNVSVKIFGDVSVAKVDIPQNMDEVAKFMKTVSGLISQCNGGKGVPVEFKLFNLKSFYRIKDIPYDRNFYDIPELIINFAHSLIDKLTKMKNSFYTFYSQFKQYEDYFVSSMAVELREIKSYLDIQVGINFDQLSRLIKQSRCEPITGEPWSALATKIKTLAEEMDKRYSKHKHDVRKKIEEIETFKEKGITVLSSKNKLENLRLKHNNGLLFVFKFSKEMRKQKTWWDNNVNGLAVLKKKHGNRATFYAVDNDLHSKKTTESGIKLDDDEPSDDKPLNGEQASGDQIDGDNLDNEQVVRPIKQQPVMARKSIADKNEVYGILVYENGKKKGSNFVRDNERNCEVM